MISYRVAEDCSGLQTCLDDGLKKLRHEFIVETEVQGWHCTMVLDNNSLSLNVLNSDPSTVYRPYHSREPIFDRTHYIGYQFGDVIKHIQLVDLSDAFCALKWENIEPVIFQTGMVRALILVPR